MDNDEAGQINVRNFAEKLGMNRTYIVKPNTLNYELFENDYGLSEED